MILGEFFFEIFGEFCSSKLVHYIQECLHEKILPRWWWPHISWKHVWKFWLENSSDCSTWNSARAERASQILVWSLHQNSSGLSNPNSDRHVTPTSNSARNSAVEQPQSNSGTDDSRFRILLAERRFVTTPWKFCSYVVRLYAGLPDGWILDSGFWILHDVSDLAW